MKHEGPGGMILILSFFLVFVFTHVGVTRFLVMNNLFNTPYEPVEIYDLKVSLNLSFSFFLSYFFFFFFFLIRLHPSITSAQLLGLYSGAIHNTKTTKPRWNSERRGYQER
jgi:hypothetical protein